MIAFLTSSPCSPGDGELTEWNGLRAELHRSLPARALQCVYIAGAPDTHDINDLYARLERERWERAGFAFSRFHIHILQCDMKIQDIAVIHNAQQGQKQVGVHR